MPVNLSIKNVPDDVAQRLRRRAEANHRSLQRELLALVEQATAPGRSAGLVVREPEANYTPPSPSPSPSSPVPPDSSDDGLLAVLDAIVAGSRWGQAPLLSRDQLHDRALAREVDFDARNAERGSGGSGGR